MLVIIFIEKINQMEKTHKFDNESEEFIETIIFGLDYYLEFGENSTVVILQDADTENLDDTLTEKIDNPDFNHGTGDLIMTDSTRDWRPYIKFDLLQIPSSSVINEAYFYLFPPSVDGLTTVKAYHVFNHTWTEGNSTGTNCNNEADCNGGIIHNRQPCGANFDDSQQCNLTAEYTLSTPGAGRWHIYNVTNTISTEYYERNNNVSIVLRDNSGGSFKQVYYNSKENANISTRPYLNITYSPATSTDLEILEIIPIQVVRGVDMVLGKTGLVRVNVKNNGPLDSNATVTITFEGINLTSWINDTNRKFIVANTNASFDFKFKPTQTGSQIFTANVSIS